MAHTERNVENVAEGAEAPDRADDIATARFGDVIENGWASEDNPQRYGYLVGRFTRAGRMNSGRHVRLTDGKGSTWEHPLHGEHRLTVVARASLPPFPHHPRGDR